MDLCESICLPAMNMMKVFKKTDRVWCCCNECWDTLIVTPMVALYSCLIHVGVLWAHLWNQHSNSNSIWFCVFLNLFINCEHFFFLILCVVFSFHTAFLVSSNKKDVLEIIPNLVFCRVFSSCHCLLLPLLPLYGVAFCHLQSCVCVYIYVCYTCVYVSICKYVYIYTYMSNIHSSLSQICLFPFLHLQIKSFQIFENKLIAFSSVIEQQLLYVFLLSLPHDTEFWIVSLNTSFTWIWASSKQENVIHLLLPC